MEMIQIYKDEVMLTTEATNKIAELERTIAELKKMQDEVKKAIIRAEAAAMITQCVSLRATGLKETSVSCLRTISTICRSIWRRLISLSAARAL